MGRGNPICGGIEGGILLTASDRKTTLRFLGLLKRYRGKIAFLMIALLISILLSLFSPMISRKLMDEGLVRGDFKVILKMILLLFAFRQISILLSLWIERKRLGIVYDFRFRLERQAIDHLLAVKADYFNQVGQSELLNQIDVDVNYICSILNTNTLSIISSIFTIVGGIGAAVYMDARLALLFFSMLPLKYLIIHIHSKFQKKKLNLFLEKNIAYARWFSEIVTGMTDIRIFGLEKKKQEEFVKMDGEKIAAHKDMDVLSQYRSLADGTLDAVLNLLIFLIGGIFIVRGELTVGSLYAFLSYSSYVMAPLSSILNLKFILTNVLPSATRFFEFLDRAEETGDGAKNKWKKNNLLAEEADPLDINFCNVVFHYNNIEGEKKEVLNGIHLKIREGEKLALIGRNGSGKTTLVKLLLRFYKSQDGSIFLADREIEEIPLKEYRELFSVVSQEIYLFNDTIRNNVCMYRDFSEDAIRAVLDEVGLSEMVSERGMDFLVGINGALLSGGQKQKVALARALLHDRPVFIFDEATSNTDIDFELRFRRMLNSRLARKTIIMITHNIDLLQAADHIVLMGEGRILCEGSYEDLRGGDEKFASWLEQNENG
jgi:ATP-binding cassette subfamily B protein/subfamily B ATP-binding cassette protein MsbA